MTDDTTPPERRKPAYGEYATPEEVAALTNRPVPPASSPSAPAQVPASAPSPYTPVAAPPRRHLADRLASGFLLGLGFVVTAVIVMDSFELELVFQSFYDRFALGDYTPPFPLDVAGAVLVISHVALFALALVGSVRLTRRGRLSWWLPLTAGIVAAVIFWSTMFVIIFADEKLVDALRVASGG